MLDTKGFITAVRTIIANGTDLALTDVYSPELPSEKTNIVAVTLLTGENLYNMCGTSHYELIFRTIVRGDSNDNTTRGLVDNIYNSLNLKQDTTNNIVQIMATSTPIFVGKDQNNNNVYNITYRAIVEGE